MRSSGKLTQPLLRKRHINTVAKRKLQPIAVPFSVAGICAMLACPALLLTDIFTPGYTFLGIIYVLLLTLLGNERRTLLALFAAVAIISVAIDFRVIYAQDGAELAVADKIFALMALPVLSYAMIQQRAAKKKNRKRKKVVNMAIIPPINERIALNGETKSVFRHICRSNGPMDEYTRELIWFVYLKSPKN